jgi:enterochelin esterase family protein
VSDAAPLVERLRAAGGLTADTLEGLIARGPAPLVEPDTCTFFYRGAADAVRLVHWGVGLPPDLGFARHPDTDLWYLVLPLPRGSRVEYKIQVSEPGGERMVEDSLNPLRAHNPFGANSVCLAAGHQTPSWADHDPAVSEGTLKDLVLDSAALGRAASTTLYLPAGFDGGAARRYPLLIVHDGGDYLHYAQLKTVLDNLIHHRQLAEIVVAFSHPGERLVEYADDPRHARFLVDELVPALEAELPLEASPSARGLMGASFGAVASLSAARRAPERFGRLLLQSGSFAWSSNGCSERRGPIWDPVKTFVDAYTAAPSAVSRRVFVSCGVYESLICENRALVPRLRETGMDVRFTESLDGHNWESWRDRLGEALPWLFPAAD